MITRAALYFHKRLVAVLDACKALRRCVVPGAGLLVSMVAVGCATGDYAYVTTVSTGERIQLPLVKGSPKLAEKGTIQIKFAGLVPSPEQGKKELHYLFNFEEKSAAVPKSVVVEDVTDEQTMLMVDDREPKVVKQHWSGRSRPFSPEEASMIWLSQLGDSMRVFRFTITAADGTKTTLYQGWMVPAWAKVPMRRAMGLK